MSKILWKNHPLLKFIWRVLLKYYYVTSIFDPHTFDDETTVLLNFFEISTEKHFVSLFLLNERNMTTSLLKIHLKCTVVHYANLNSSSIKKHYKWVVEYTILLFFDLIYVYFNNPFVKNFMQILSFFNANFQNPLRDVVCYRILGCQTFLY